MPIINMVYKKKKGWKPGANTLAYYPLNGNLNDYSGNGYNSIASGGTLTYPDDKYLQLSNGWSRFNTSLNSDITTSLTISLWEKDIPYNSEKNIFCIGVDTIGHWSFRLLGNNGGIKVGTTNGSRGIETGAYSVTSSVWHHLVAILKPSNYIKLYIDGVLKETKTISYNPRNPGGYTAIGQCGTNYSQSITGNLDEVILEDKERTADEISDYYNQTKGNYQSSSGGGGSGGSIPAEPL